jgi:hypothetical protein
MMTWIEAHDKAATMKREDLPRIWNTLVMEKGDHVMAFVMDDQLLVPTDEAGYIEPIINYAHLEQIVARVRPFCKVRRLSEARADRMWRDAGVYAVLRAAH